MAKPCEHCTDGNPDESQAKCVYPYYGLAPHRHDLSITGSIIGSTVTDPKSAWPANFRPDYEEGDDPTQDIPGMCGTYTHCLECGQPKQEGNADGK